MADCERPSFSLGLDSLFDSEPQPLFDPAHREPQCEERDEFFGAHVSDSDLETPSEPPRVLRRLRRGLPPPPQTTPLKRDLDDEIEEFSSQEEPRSSAQFYSTCSSSKNLLRSCGAIAKPSRKVTTKKNESASTVTAESTEASNREKLFANVAVSPLRRFQLIDSDSESDYPSRNDDLSATRGNETNRSSKNQGDCSTSRNQPSVEDLWKDFRPIKSLQIPTPALDEMCKEYFHSVKNSKSCSEFRENRNGQSTEHPSDEAKSLVSAHRYFLHQDLRIRKLVRDRLPNFVPLGVNDNVRNQQNGASAIDYMGQFGNQEASKRQATQPIDLERSSKRGRNALSVAQGKSTQKSTAKKSSRKPKSKSTVEASPDWIDPKTSKKEQNDSNGQSVGQWYTGSNGKKVYVNKSGQELTGRSAYSQYKKDNGGFNKGIRKSSKKKKS